MAVTLTPVSNPYSTGDRFRTVYTLALDNSYPTGGYALAPTSLGFAATTDPEFDIEVSGLNGYGWRYDYTAQKLLVYSAAGTQVANATDLSAVTAARVRATGKYRG